MKKLKIGKSGRQNRNPVFILKTGKNGAINFVQNDPMMLKPPCFLSFRERWFQEKKTVVTGKSGPNPNSTWNYKLYLQVAGGGCFNPNQCSRDNDTNTRYRYRYRYQYRYRVSQKMEVSGIEYRYF
jgi:hypothetical protein